MLHLETCYTLKYQRNYLVHKMTEMTGKKTLFIEKHGKLNPSVPAVLRTYLCYNKYLVLRLRPISID